MSKFKASIESIECADRLMRLVQPLYKKLKEQEGMLSEDEIKIQKSMIGSQLGLICEYYLKGLIIPNVKINVPDELKEIVGDLSEEQELMIIVADDEKIRNDPVLGRLDRRQLRLLGKNSIKNIGHGLIHLLGSRTLSEDKEIHIDERVRKAIVTEMKANLFSKEELQTAQGFIEWWKLSEPLEGYEDKHLLKSDRTIEEGIENKFVSDAFVRGRYGMFDGFIPDIDTLYKLAHSIRKGVTHQYNNIIEILEDSEETVGKFIYPDPESIIYIHDNEDNKLSREYEMVPDVYFFDGIMGASWRAELIKGNQVYRKRDIEILKDMSDDSFREIQQRQMDSPSLNIYYNQGRKKGISIQYMCQGEKKFVELINGELVEVRKERDRDEKGKEEL